MKLFATAALATVLLSAGSAGAAVNLVQNGSFDNPPTTFAWHYDGHGYGGGDANTYPAKIIAYKGIPICSSLLKHAQASV